ncbi:MAG TPA: hypothetical protein VLE19_00580 [Pyrinomonadaceae bacterium]|nr:hypothetical protein [Pyrinomonadaceae bacterium]
MSRKDRPVIVYNTMDAPRTVVRCLKAENGFDNTKARGYFASFSQYSAVNSMSSNTAFGST